VRKGGGRGKREVGKEEGERWERRREMGKEGREVGGKEGGGEVGIWM
jgi:hypothetical protein